MKIIIKWTSIFLIKIQNSAPAQAGSTVESFLFKGGGGGNVWGYPTTEATNIGPPQIHVIMIPRYVIFFVPLVDS